MRVFGTHWFALALLLSLSAIAKENNKVAPKIGISTPGIRIPLASLKADAEITTTAPVEGLLTGDSSYVVVKGSDTLLPLNAKTNKLEEAIAGFHKLCGDPVNGFGTLWVRNCGEASLARLDTKEKKIKGSVPVSVVAPAGSMQSSSDSIWILNDEKTTLSRIDPDQNSVVAETRLPAGCNALLFAENALWVTCPSDGKLLRVEPATNLVKERIEVAAEPIAMASGESSIWVYGRKEGKVSRVDPKTNKVTATIDLKTPGLAGDIAFGEGFVWVSSPGFPITRIDPASDKVAQQFFGEGGGAIYFGTNSVWVPNLKPNTLSRFDVKRIKATLAD